MSLQDSIGDEASRHLSATEPSSVQALDSALGRVDGIKLDINLALL